MPPRSHQIGPPGWAAKPPFGVTLASHPLFGERSGAAQWGATNGTPFSSSSRPTGATKIREIEIIQNLKATLTVQRNFSNTLQRHGAKNCCCGMVGPQKLLQPCVFAVEALTQQALSRTTKPCAIAWVVMRSHTLPNYEAAERVSASLERHDRL